VHHVFPIGSLPTLTSRELACSRNLNSDLALTPPAGTQAAFLAPAGNTQSIPATLSTERGGNKKHIAPDGPKLHHFRPGFLLIQAKTSNTRVTAAVASLTLHRTTGSCLLVATTSLLCLGPLCHQPLHQHPLRYRPWHRPWFVRVTLSFVCVRL